MHEFLNLKIHYEYKDHVIIGLYDVSGKFLEPILKDGISNKGIKNYTLPFKYPAGIYLLNIHYHLGRQSIKITKNKTQKIRFNFETDFF